MIETMRMYSSHSLFGIMAEGIPALIKTLEEVVYSIAVSILMQVFISIPLFYLHHNLFALGFVIGFIFDKEVRIVVEKVNVVYNAHRTLLQQVIFFGGGGFLAILTMPTSTIIATFYYSAQWGALLYQSCLAASPPDVVPPADPADALVDDVLFDAEEPVLVHDIASPEIDLEMGGVPPLDG